jgi:hypothetical protein
MTEELLAGRNMKEQRHLSGGKAAPGYVAKNPYTYTTSQTSIIEQL